MTPLVERVKGLLERCTPGLWTEAAWLDILRLMFERDAENNIRVAAALVDWPPEQVKADAALIALCPSMAKELVELAGEVERLRAAETLNYSVDSNRQYRTEQAIERAEKAEAELVWRRQIDTSAYDAACRGREAAETALAEINTELAKCPVWALGAWPNLQRIAALATLTRSTKPEGQE